MPSWQRIAVAAVTALFLIMFAFAGYVTNKLDAKADQCDIVRIESKVDWLILFHINKEDLNRMPPAPPVGKEK